MVDQTFRKIKKKIKSDFFRTYFTGRVGVGATRYRVQSSVLGSF